MFVQRGCIDFRSAARFVQGLPYGRTSRRDPSLVLVEGRGTCSTKHALLRQLARGHGQPVRLCLGIYAMRDENTPGVGPILEAFGLTWIPEAHCYLRSGDAVIDVTGIEATEDPLASLLHEEDIEPEQIAEYKGVLHRQFIADWASSRNVDSDQAWEAREACIRMLEQRAASLP